jgi:nucleotide-binding universal stress UspA family protein
MDLDHSSDGWKLSSVRAPGDKTMGTDQNELVVKNRSKGRSVLVVADFLTSGDHILEFASELAKRYDAHLELMQVIDPRRSHSNPDSDMGAQFNLEVFADKLRTLRMSVVSLLSFGHPEDVIPKRAAAIQASLIIFPLTSSEIGRAKKGLINRLIRKCRCPVLAFPVDTPGTDDRGLIEIQELSSVIRKLQPCERQTMQRSADLQRKPVAMLRGA